ncbi:hypothetical protein I7I53_06618 [Histoplasma capsulatum var. duboisii H88]|uniref:Uncharacterized protein n=1 Tax=Ajellomyces capsulatus (strain H88) TaxID=544711 RepID=A0A8A1LFV1_AJEC8|nr:hypothetical protein I7I53_06618 [Histoplasma capsulatum var. duboisii H88]
MAMFVLILITRPWQKGRKKKREKRKENGQKRKKTTEWERIFEEEEEEGPRKGVFNLQEDAEPSRPWVSRRSTSLYSEH